MLSRTHAALALLIAGLAVPPARAQDHAPTAASPAPRGWGPTGAALTWDNDLFAGTDRHYTNGIALSLRGRVPDHAAPRLLGDQVEWRLTLGQKVFTPEALREAEPLLDDRPYGGWLYLGLRLVGHEPALKRSHSLGISLGVVGPAAGADGLQRFVHRDLLDGVLPEGWRHQAPTEPGLLVRYELTERLERGSLSQFGFSHDLAARLGFELGSVRTAAWLGITGRAGWGLPDAYVSPLPPCDFRLYFSASFDLTAVAHDVFLDGSLLRPGGVRVERSPLVARASLGLTIELFDAVSLSYRHVVVTPEFEGQASTDSYGSLSLALSW